MSKSFGLHSVKDYYGELLVPSFAEFRAEPLSCFSCHQLRDLHVASV